MKKTKLMIALLAGLTLGACSNDNDELTPQPKQEPLFPITIEVTETPMTQDGEEGSDATRSDITTGSSASFTSFYMDYVYGASNDTGHKTSTRNGDTWTTDGTWPTDAISTDDEVNWYAHTGGTFNENGGSPYLNFTVDENVATQHDLLVGTTSGTYSGTGGKLSFEFNHVCSALRFLIKKSTNLNGYKLDVSEVVLCNILNHAKYYYATGWSDFYETRSVYTLFSGSQQNLGSGSWIEMDGGSGDYLFLIPQTLTAWNHTTAIASVTEQTYLKVNCTITNTSTSTQVHSGYAYIPFGYTLVGNKKYNVKINIGKNSLFNSSGTLIINP